MNKSIIVFLVSLTIVSCSSDSDEYLYNRLQGDWISTLHNRFLTFKDSLVADDYMDLFRSYYFDNDTLIIENLKTPSHYDRGNRNFYYKCFIDSISTNYIWLLGSEEEYIPIYYSTDRYYNENIILKSIEIRFGNERYRGMRSWWLNIDNNLNSYLKIDGYRKVRKEFLPLPYEGGNYFAHLTPEEFEYIQNKVQRIPYGELKEEYSPEWAVVGIQKIIRIKINIGYKDNSKINSIIVTSIGYEGIPGPLLVLINYLKQIHYFVDFERTDQLHDFEFE